MNDSVITSLTPFHLTRETHFSLNYIPPPPSSFLLPQASSPQLAGIVLTLSSPLSLVPDATHGCVSWTDLLRSLGPHLEGYDAKESGLEPGPGQGLGQGLAQGSGRGLGLGVEEEEEDVEVVVGVSLMGDKDEEDEEEEEEEDGSDEGFDDTPTLAQSPGLGLAPGQGSRPVEIAQSSDNAMKTPSQPDSPDPSASPGHSPDPSPSPGPDPSPGMLARIAQSLTRPNRPPPKTPPQSSSPPAASSSPSTRLTPLTTTALATHNTDLPPRPVLSNPSHRMSYNTMVESDNQSNHDQSNHDQSNLNDKASVGSRGSQGSSVGSMLGRLRNVVQRVTGIGSTPSPVAAPPVVVVSPVPSSEPLAVSSSSGGGNALLGASGSPGANANASPLRSMMTRALTLNRTSPPQPSSPKNKPGQAQEQGHTPGQAQGPGHMQGPGHTPGHELASGPGLELGYEFGGPSISMAEAAMLLAKRRASLGDPPGLMCMY